VNVKTINQFNQNALHCEAQWSSGGKESKLSETFEYLVSQGLELTVKDTYDDKSPIEYLIDSNRVFSVKHVFKNIISEVVNKIDLETDEFLFKVLLSIQEYPNKKEKELLLDTFAKFPKLLSHFDDQLYESKLKLREMAIKVLININDDKSIELLKGRAETESNKGLLKLLNKYLDNK